MLLLCLAADVPNLLTPLIRARVCRLEVFRLADHLVLMVDGRVAFEGPPTDAAPYFERMGFERLPEVNPCEWGAAVVRRWQPGRLYIGRHRGCRIAAIRPPAPPRPHPRPLAQATS